MDSSTFNCLCPLPTEVCCFKRMLGNRPNCQHYWLNSLLSLKSFIENISTSSRNLKHSSGEQLRRSILRFVEGRLINALINATNSGENRLKRISKSRAIDEHSINFADCLCLFAGALNRSRFIWMEILHCQTFWPPSPLIASEIHTAGPTD